MNDALRAWRTILYVKQRARDRAEESLSACRNELQQRSHAWNTVEAERDSLKQRRVAAKHTLDDALSQAALFEPESYLLHQAYMKRLDGDIVEAGKACDAARRHVIHAQGQVDQAQKILTRADASLKACSEKARALREKRARQIEEAADEESCETAAQRLYRIAHA
ncbi:MAG: hypothetical protein ACRYHA_17500 [Janthinobacterium lividum]